MKRNSQNKYTKNIRYEEGGGGVGGEEEEQKVPD